MKRVMVFLLVLALGAGAAFADDAAEKSLSVRTFQFKHKQAEKAAALIKSLMSSEGSIAIQAGTNALIVTDQAENMKKISAALKDYDAPPQAFRLSLRLIAAGRGEGTARVPADLRHVAPNLTMLGFTSFEKLGEADVTGREGDPGILDMSNGYRAEFKFGEYDLASDSIKVSDLKILRLDGPQKDQMTQVLKTSLNLKVGQTFILGASKVPQSQRALMIVVAAER